MKKLIIDDAVPYLRDRLEGIYECDYLPGERITSADVREADGLIVRTRTRCNASLLEGSNVSFVATGTIGLDHFDTEWLDTAGIHWQNAPGCNAPAVAQYVWSALLRLGFRPDRHTLGVVGKGHVGSIVCEWGRILGADVIVCDPPRAERGLTDEKYMSLEELAGAADAVTFHTPLTRTGKWPSYRMASEGFFAGLREDAILVNAARGGVVDESTLNRAIRGKHIRAAIDTWQGEPVISRETLDNALIATPHIAGYSRQGKERATLAIIRGLNTHFGTQVSTEGLAEPYSTPNGLDAETILESFDPMPTDAYLRSDPGNFEVQRDSYIFREELAI